MYHPPALPPSASPPMEARVPPSSLLSLAHHRFAHLRHIQSVTKPTSSSRGSPCPCQVPGQCQPTYGGGGNSGAAACRTVTRQQCQPIQRNVCRQVFHQTIMISHKNLFTILSISRCPISPAKLFQSRTVHQQLARLKSQMLNS